MQSSFDLDATCINVMRTLSMDTVQAANSGHPSAPMAAVAYCRWPVFLQFDPLDPTWPNRDLFVLSAGHASMLLYSLKDLARKFGFTPEQAIAAVKEQLQRSRT
jgi:transketolase